MPLVLYNAKQSTCSQRVRYALHENGLSFSEHLLDLFSGDQLKPEYLAINPNGVVPTLIDDGRVIIDSSVIVEYIDEVYAEGASLVPSDPTKRAEMRSWMRFIDEVPTPAVRVPSYNAAFLPHFQSMSEAEFLALAESKPLRKDFLLAMGRTGFSEAEMSKAVDRLNKGILRMAAALDGGGPWLLGEQFTLADIAIMPVLVRMEDLGMAHMWADHPRVAEWLRLIKLRPAFEKTFYEGALLSEKYPVLGLPGIDRPARQTQGAA